MPPDDQPMMRLAIDGQPIIGYADVLHYMTLGLEMEAISLWQPWASAMAVEIKFIETRSWMAPMRLWGKRIGIAAAKRKPQLADQPAGLSWPWTLTLPRGALVATTRLAYCGQVQRDGGALRVRVPPNPGHSDGFWIDLPPPHSREWELGHIAEGRWLWYCEDTREITSPVPCRGRQQFWRIPADVMALIPEVHLLNKHPLE